MVNNYLYHHGILGQKWGIRRYQNKDGSLTDAGQKRYSYTSDDKVFISGKVAYDKPIDKNIRKQVDKIIKANANVLIGDAPGADKRVQEYLAEKGYDKVKVYTAERAGARYNIGNWDVENYHPSGKALENMNKIESDAKKYATKKSGFEWTDKSFERSVDNLYKKYSADKAKKIVESYLSYEHNYEKSHGWHNELHKLDFSRGKKAEKELREIRRLKDIAMTNDSTKAVAIMPKNDRKGSAMSKNVKRVKKSNKPLLMYDYTKEKYYYK